MSFIPHVQYPTIVPGTCYGQPDGSFKTTREGLASAKERFFGLYKDFVKGGYLTVLGTSTPGQIISRVYKTAHPDFPSLLVYDSDVKRGKAGTGWLDVEYRGLDPALHEIPPPVYTRERTTGNEPLITHPKWITDIAGTPAAPLNGAQFVSVTGNVESFNPGVSGGPDSGFNAATAIFKQWLASSIMAGRDDYLAPGAVFLKTYTSFSSPQEMDFVGKFQKPDGPAPIPPEGYDWFFLGETSSDEAGLFRNQASWKLAPTDKGTQIIYG